MELAPLALFSALLWAAPAPPSTGDETPDIPVLPTKAFSASELKDQYAQNLFPAIKAAVETYGMSVTGHSCNVAAGFTLSAFKAIGMADAKVRLGMNHVYNEANAGGTTLIFDASAAQFYKDGSPTRKALSEIGFVGTEDELKQLLADQIEDWDFEGGGGNWTPIDPKVLAVSRGKPDPDLTQKEAQLAMAPYIDHAIDTYFAQATPGLKRAAEAQDRFHFDPDPNKRYVDGEGQDKTEPLRAAYASLDRALRSAYGGPKAPGP